MCRASKGPRRRTLQTHFSCAFVDVIRRDVALLFRVGFVYVLFDRPCCGTDSWQTGHGRGLIRRRRSTCTLGINDTQTARSSVVIVRALCSLRWLFPNWYRWREVLLAATCVREEMWKWHDWKRRRRVAAVSLLTNLEL